MSSPYLCLKIVVYPSKVYVTPSEPTMQLFGTERTLGQAILVTAHNIGFHGQL